MKKFTAILLALMMVFAFTACGESSEEPEPETTEAEQTNHEVTGIVEDLANAQLSIYTEADQDLTFNIENAAINSENGIETGDTATVEYSGEISNGDTSACTVISVTDVPASTTTIEGTVKSIDGDNITISSNDRDYTFKAKDVASKGSVKKGDKVQLKYAGMLNGTDTSHAVVKGVEPAKDSEEKTEKKADDDSITIKAVNETVYASATVNVRADASISAEKIATVKKGTKLTRTGKLSNGWSRVTYKDKDRYIASSYLTTKAPKKQESTKKTEEKTKATETKATEKKASETKATETKATETQTKETETQTQETETQTQETETQTQETEPPTEAPTEPPTEATEPPTEAPTEPATVTAKGVVTAVGSNSLTLDNGMTFNVKGAKIDSGLSEENAVGQTVQVEYYDGTKDAINVYAVSGSKSLDGEDSSTTSSATVIAIILALIAIAIAVIVVVVRNRRKPEVK